MIIRGYFKDDAPYFTAHVLFTHFQGFVRFLADTGASRTLLSASDAGSLGVQTRQLEPAERAIVGVGGSVRSLLARNARLTLEATETYVPIRLDLIVVQHDWGALPHDEINRILRLPSVLGRDVLNRFRFTSDYGSGIVQLARP